MFVHNFVYCFAPMPITIFFIFFAFFTVFILYLSTWITIISLYWSLNFHHDHFTFSPGLHPWSSLLHLLSLATSLMTLDVYMLTAHTYTPTRTSLRSPGLYAQLLLHPSSSPCLMATPSFRLLSPNLDITLNSSLSHFTSTLLGNSVAATSKIYPNSDHFMPSSLLSHQCECPSSLVSMGSLLPRLHPIGYSQHGIQSHPLKT